MDEKGILFDIQRFSVHDGPGIRTTVFLKGCPLRCIWCHNPEGYQKAKEILFRQNLCIGCGECSVCPESAHSMVNGVHQFDRSLCLSSRKKDACGRCASVCPSEALKMAGREATVEEVLRTVQADSSYYQSTGGMTISGGEPFFQPEFTLALLKEAKSRKINTAVETSGFTSETIFGEALPYIDTLLFDIKLIGEDEHVKYTGVSNKTILKNLSTASNQKTDLILRCPIIPTVNNCREHIYGIADLANALPAVKEIHLEPYHSMGASKNTQLGISTCFHVSPPSKEEIVCLRDSLAKLVPVNVKILK